VTVLAIKGEVSSGPEGVGQLSRILDGLVAQGVTHLVVDLTDAEFLVSRALGQIVTTAIQLRSRSGDMMISGARGPVAAAALTVGVGEMIQFHKTVDEAAAALVSQYTAKKS